MGIFFSHIFYKHHQRLSESLYEKIWQISKGDPGKMGLKLLIESGMKRRLIFVFDENKFIVYQIISASFETYHQGWGAGAACFGALKPEPLESIKEFAAPVPAPRRLKA